MSYVNISTVTATPATQEILKQIYTAFGATPNMFKAVANSPAALKSMWGSFGALGSGALGAKLGEQIAAAVANRNRCEYCLAAHTVLGQSAGVSAQDMSAAQGGKSTDPKIQSALTFALKIVEQRAAIGQADVEAVRAAGFNDGEIVEIMAHVALNVFTNYVNVAFNVPVDFPKIALKAA
jgi:uncharacterized peroxidase-related enzyme